MQHFYLYLLALGAGVSVATQQVLNGSLRMAVGSPAWAGLISYAAGLVTMSILREISLKAARPAVPLPRSYRARLPGRRPG